MIPAVLLGDLNMLRCFAGSGVRAIVASSDPREPTLSSRYVDERAIIHELGEDSQGLFDLEAIGRAHPERPTLFYGTDRQLRFIARHRARLEPLFRFRMPPTELVERLVDKTRFAELAGERSIPTPLTVCSCDTSGPKDVMRRIPGPWLIKPNGHDGWFRKEAVLRHGPKKAVVAETAEELERLYAGVLETTQNFVVQQYVPGGEDEVYSFHAYLDGNGTVLGHFVGKKIRTFPREAGVSTYLELVIEPRVTALGLEVVRALQLVGPIKIDLKRDARSGRFYVLELNARYNLWHYLGSACGVNLPLLAHSELTGDPCALPGEQRTGVKWLSFGGDLRSFLKSYRPSGELGVASWLHSLRGPKVHDVFAWSDPVPSLVGAMNYARALGRRLWRAHA
jgi:predicted ATP-grasp superfamily ATP-dependent carboligase